MHTLTLKYKTESGTHIRTCLVRFGTARTVRSASTATLLYTSHQLLSLHTLPPTKLSAIIMGCVEVASAKLLPPSPPVDGLFPLERLFLGALLLFNSPRSLVTI